MADNWWRQDWNEELTIISLAAIAVISLFFNETVGNEIPLAIGSGLVGYLKGKQDGGKR